jgi:hypothetical protein
LQVRGILNGIDVVEWDPAADPLLPANYNAQFPDGKKICKKYLQKVRGARGAGAYRTAHLTAVTKHCYGIAVEQQQHQMIVQALLLGGVLRSDEQPATKKYTVVLHAGFGP